MESKSIHYNPGEFEEGKGRAPNGSALFLSAFAEDHACVPKPLPPWGPSAKTCTSACRHGLCPWMNADSAVRSFVCRWANATADSATGGYPAEALGLRTGRIHRRWAQAGISWRYHGLCPWGSMLNCSATLNATLIPSA
jgi:ribosome modulation factor